MKFAFFGTPEIATIVLTELEKVGLLPSLVVTNPDALVGRKQILTPPPVAVWAKERKIEVFQPITLKDRASLETITNTTWDIFVVVAYGKILPDWLLKLPTHGTVNVHPSLLPKLRGASPIRSAILADIRETGVTIMLMDKAMDHGPILNQEITDIPESKWPLDGQALDQIMAKQGGQLLASTLMEYVSGEIIPQEQDHEAATFCGKITKEMSELMIDPHNLPSGQIAYDLLLKIRAFSGWPETFFIHDGKRIKIKSADLNSNGQLEIKRIIPEGKSEVDFETYFK